MGLEGNSFPEVGSLSYITEEHASIAMANTHPGFQVSPDFKDGYSLEIPLVLHPKERCLNSLL